MGNRYTDTYVYIQGGQRLFHRYYAALGNSYEAIVEIGVHSYSILDLLDGDTQTHGTALPSPGLTQWASLFSDAPDSQALEALALAGYAPQDVKKLLWLRLDSVRSGVCEAEGCLLSPAGTQALRILPQKSPLLPDDYADSLARAYL